MWSAPCFHYVSSTRCRTNAGSLLDVLCMQRLRSLDFTTKVTEHFLYYLQIRCESKLDPPGNKYNKSHVIISLQSSYQTKSKTASGVNQRARHTYYGVCTTNTKKLSKFAHYETMSQPSVEINDQVAEAKEKKKMSEVKFLSLVNHVSNFKGYHLKVCTLFLLN